MFKSYLMSLFRELDDTTEIMRTLEADRVELSETLHDHQANLIVSKCCIIDRDKLYFICFIWNIVT